MSILADITPDHDPISLARDMVELAPKAKAGLYVLVTEDGRIKYDMAGHERAYIMWALQRMVHDLITSD